MGSIAICLSEIHLLEVTLAWLRLCMFVHIMFILSQGLSKMCLIDTETVSKLLWSCHSAFTMRPFCLVFSVPLVHEIDMEMEPLLGRHTSTSLCSTAAGQTQLHIPRCFCVS